MNFILRAVALTLLTMAGLFAQTFGDISGEVRDPSGAAISDASVALVNTATNATRTTKTNNSGVYAFPALQPGTYNLRAEKTGFKSFTRSGLEVQVQLSARVSK